jgi:putative NADH-flavin reductase
MNIVVYGASGMIGQRITQEALNRGHKITAIIRNPARLTFTHPHLTVEEGNILAPNDVAQKVAGYDAVVNATRQFYARTGGPDEANAESAPTMVAVPHSGQTFVDVAHALIEGLTRAGVRRLIVVGGAGSLEVAPGLQFLDAPTFPPEHRPVALSLRDALAVYRSADLDWTFFSPAPGIAPGERTGHYRLGTDQLVVDEQGKSRISAEDYAVALVDELETPRFLRRRFTAAY